jgi:hypothetical protein
VDFHKRATFYKSAGLPVVHVRALLDVIDLQRHVVPGALGVDGDPTFLAVQAKGNGEKRFQRVPLLAAGGRHIRLATADADVEIPDSLDHLGGNSRSVVPDFDAARVDAYAELGRNVGVLGGVECVVEQFAEDDGGPLVPVMACLRGQALGRHEVEQTGGAEGGAVERGAVRAGPALASGCLFLYHFSNSLV